MTVASSSDSSFVIARNLSVYHAVAPRTLRSLYSCFVAWKRRTDTKRGDSSEGEHMEDGVGLDGADLSLLAPLHFASSGDVLSPHGGGDLDPSNVNPELSQFNQDFYPRWRCGVASGTAWGCRLGLVGRFLQPVLRLGAVLRLHELN